MRRYRGRWRIAAIIVAFLASGTWGCGRSVAPDADAAPAGKWVLEFRRDGGDIVLFRDRLKIRKDGRAVDGSGRHFTVPKQQLAKITALLDASRFTALPSQYPVCCGVVFTLRYRGHTVTGGDKAMPTEVQQALGALAALVEAHRST